jgi:hypothetical protein
MASRLQLIDEHIGKSQTEEMNTKPEKWISRKFQKYCISALNKVLKVQQTEKGKEYKMGD